MFVFLSCIDTNKEKNNNSSKKISEEDSIKIILKKYPDSLPLLQKMVSISLEKEHYSDAIQIIDNAIVKDSSNDNLWDMKSLVLLQKGDTNNAINALKKAVAIFPHPNYIITLGELYAENHNPQALQMADALLVATKAHAEPQAYFIKGLYYSYKNEKEKAISFFDESIVADYNFAEAYLEKALALYDLKKYQEAATVLEKIVKLKNQFTDGYYYLGKCYEKLNRTEEAKEVYELAIQLNPDFEEAKDALGRMR